MSAALFPIAADLINNVLSRVLGPDKQKLAEAQAEMSKIMLSQEMQVTLAQIEVNKAEATSQHWFVAGWRPFIGWVCGTALAYHFILQPLLAFFFSAAGHPVALPVFDMDQLMTILLGMLGLGTMRTFEKINRTTTAVNAAVEMKKAGK